MKTAIDKLIEELGGTQPKAGEALGVSQSYISQLNTGTETISPELCVIAEIKTKGKVKRIDLRPDVFGELEYDQEAA